jgi:glycosyltransferase involved in cell wall biosynthesis
MISIYPNYAASIKNSEIWIESSQVLVNRPIVNLGINIQIVAVSNNYDCLGNFEILDKNITFKNIGNFNPKSSKLLKLFFYFKALRNIRDSVKKSNFNYIYCPGHVGLITSVLCIIYNKQYGIYLRGEWSDSTPKIFNFLFNIIIKKSLFLICTGDSLTNKISKINPNCESVVPMTPILFMDIRHDQKLINHDSKIINILFVGQLSRSKGVFELIDSFEYVTKVTKFKLRLKIIGDGYEKIEIIKLIEKKKLTNNIEVYSIVSNYEKLSEVYLNSDIFCLPSYTEGFPRVLYEAMYFSLPIITTNVGQIPFFIKDNFNGIFCDVKSTKSLINSLEYLINNPLERVKLAANAKKSIEPLLENWKKKSHGIQIINFLQKNDKIYETLFN